MTFVTAVPTTTFIAGARGASLTPTLSNNSSTALGIAPMGVESVAPTVTIGLQRFDGSAYTDVAAATLDALADGLHVATTDEAGPHVRTDSYPIGVWGQPGDEDNKPMPAGDVVHAGSQFKLVAGILTAAVGPEIDYRQVTAGRRPLPLLADEAERTALLTTASTVPVIAPTTATEALATAQTVLFSTRASVAAGVLPRRAQRRRRHGVRRRPDRAAEVRDARWGDSGDERSFARPPTALPLLRRREGRGPPADRHRPARRRCRRARRGSGDDGRRRLDQASCRSHRRLRRAAVSATNSLFVSTDQRRRDGDSTGRSSSRRTRALTSPGRPPATSAGDSGARTSMPSSPASPPVPARLRSPRRPRQRSARGDLVVLEQVDAAIDVAAERRPRLRIDGAARVVMVRAAGAIAVDREVTDEAVDVPPRVQLSPSRPTASWT